jgi:hypothetical protein
MAILQTKGSSPYAGYNRAPVEMANSESRVVFAAFRGAVEAVLEKASVPNKSKEMEEANMAQLLTLRSLYDEMREDLDQIDLMLSVATNRTMSLE